MKNHFVFAREIFDKKKIFVFAAVVAAGTAGADFCYYLDSNICINCIEIFIPKICPI